MANETHNKEDVLNTLNRLRRERDDLIFQMNKINSKIKDKTKTIEYYEGLCFKQYKAF